VTLVVVEGAGAIIGIMVSATLLAAVEALSDDERVELADFIEQSFTHDAPGLTDQERAVIDRRAAEMDANPGLGYSLAKFEARIQARFA
jgi:putative addiction module component (TIGR02574 family)